MRIKDFPYGTPTKTLRAAVTWLNRNKHRIIFNSKLGTCPYDDFFDYPDYWNMPKKISGRLSGDDVDWIQEETYEWHSGKTVLRARAALTAPIVRCVGYEDIAKKILTIAPLENKNGKTRKRNSKA